MIAKKPKMLLHTLAALILIIAVALGCTFTGAGGDNDQDVTLYERAGLAIAIPDEYADQLLIDPVESDDDATLIRVYQKSTYEKHDGMGFLFSILRYTEAQYEQYLCSDGSGQSFFARDEMYYYGFFEPTDVQAPDDYEAYRALSSAVGDFVKNDMIERNGLTIYSNAEFFNKIYTYDSEHIFINYYPYYASRGSKEEIWTLVLSQPATRGNTGIWCVERWKDLIGNVYPYFPGENGVPSKEYYTEQQAQCDAGHLPYLLNPEQVAIAFVKKVFGHSDAILDSFARTEVFGLPSELFAASSGDIHDYIPKLAAGEKVSPYDLLPCLENFTQRTWSELEEAYGGRWWDPLWTALRDAALSDMPADSDDQMLRDYYLGKAYLTADGAYTEMISDLVLRQWKDNSTIYNTCLDARFSVDEAAAMRRHLAYLVSHRGGEFHILIPGDDPELTLSLNPYPVDFPFGTGLTEKSRETFRVESFGNVTVVESGGLQVKYLHNSDGVYTVYGIRAAGEGYKSTGVAIGDPEEKLWDFWLPAQLKKVNDGILADDEAWFGDDYDSAYAYTPEGTKNILYLIKDGRVSGIEVVNGLDGALY